jgi:hypothetical protein
MDAEIEIREVVEPQDCGANFSTELGEQERHLRQTGATRQQAEDRRRDGPSRPPVDPAGAGASLE